MPTNLDTGIIPNPFSGVTKAGGVVVDNTPSERVVYPNAHQQLIRVLPGHMVVLTAYGLQDDVFLPGERRGCSEVVVKKLLLSNGIPATASGTGCCVTMNDGAETALLNRVAVPAYRMTVDNPIRVLNIPGWYMVEVFHDAEQEAVVTAMAHPLQINGPTIQNIECACPLCDGPRGPILD